MPALRIAAVPLNQTPIDWPGNLRRVVAGIAAARESGARLVVLPELALSAYGCEDLYFARDVRERSLRSLEELLPHTAGVAVVVGLALEVAGSLYNGAAVVVDGRPVGVALKQHLANDGLHYEARWFRAWPAGERGAVEIAGACVPVGELVFDFAGVGVGLEVCRDAWVGSLRPACRFAGRGVSLVLNPSASHFAFGKQAVRRRLAVEGADAVRGAFLYVNLLGNESGRTVFDGGVLLAEARGDLPATVTADPPRFAMTDHALRVFDVEVDARGPIDAVPTGFDLAAPEAPPISAPAPRGGEPSREVRKLEDFSRVAPLAMLDYLRRSGARGFVLSLSGGADSAACATLVWLMVRLGFEQLGPAGLAARLPNTPGLADAQDPRDAVRRLLTTVYQATANSSATTRAAAAAVADAVGAEHHEWEIDSLVAGYTRLAESAVGRALDWATDDLALQNVQARVRSPGVWMLANLRQALLLTTGNRSEASVGYCTMDGDTSGGLAPLSGIDKAFLLEWLDWMREEGPEGIGPLSELAAVTRQRPTAELRPAGVGRAAQTDEDDLMPYDVLDAIERSAIARLETPEQTLAGLREGYPEADPAQLAAWVERFWGLWRASQWKRERMAPGFHLDTHSVDPRAWRRWPILSARRSE